MWLCYAIATIPVVLGAFLWLFTRRITFGEWMLGSAIGLAVAIGFHVYAIVTLTLDAQIASGPVTQVTHYPAYPDSEAETGWAEHWAVTLDLHEGRADFEIPQDEFESILTQFGAPEMETIRPEAYAPSDEEYRAYIARNETGVLIPGWTISAARRQSGGSDVFSFSEPPDGLPLHEYPFGVDGALFEGWIGRTQDRPYVRALEYQGFDWRRSKRLLGRAAEDLSIERWDAINAELGQQSGVNLIAIGFDGDTSLGHWQEAKWRGGKRNDVVICYGPRGDDGKPAWTYCFGWTADATVKRNLESLFLTHGANDALLAAVRDEVAASYRPREWPEFRYFAVRAPHRAIEILILVTLLLQFPYWVRALLDTDRRAAAGPAEIAEEEEHERRQFEANRLAEVRAELGRRGVPSEGALTAADMVRCLFAKSQDVRLTAEDWLNTHERAPADAAAAQDVVPWLIEMLEDQDAAARAEALRLLELIAPRWRDRADATDAIPRLLAPLRTKFPRAWHFDALGARGPLVYDDLVEMAAEVTKVSGAHALKALGHTGDARAVALLIEGLDAEKEVHRRFAASGLANFGAGLRDVPEAHVLLERIPPLLSSREEGERIAALRALGWLGRDEAVPAIVPFLTSTVGTTRYWAADALGWIGTRSAIDALVESLGAARDDELILRITALGRTRDEAIVAPLLELHRAQRNKSRPLGQAILEAVYRLGGDDVERLLVRECDEDRGSVPYLARLRLAQRRDDRHAWSR